MSKNTHITVLAKDNDRPGNREVEAFLRQHLVALVRAGIQFEFKIADDKMDKALVARNITKLPAIEVKSAHGQITAFQTPVEIKSALLKFMAAAGIPTGPNATMLRSRKKAPEDELEDYYKSEMTIEKAEEDAERGDDDRGSSMMDKYQREVERRQREDEKKGPKKPVKGRRRPANVSDDDVPAKSTGRRPPADDDDLDISTPRRREAAPMTPQERLKAAGGDPGSKDDLLIMNMMESSDD